MPSCILNGWQSNSSLQSIFLIDGRSNTFLNLSHRTPQTFETYFLSICKRLGFFIRCFNKALYESTIPKTEQKKQCFVYKPPCNPHNMATTFKSQQTIQTCSSYLMCFNNLHIISYDYYNILTACAICIYGLYLPLCNKTFFQTFFVTVDKQPALFCVIQLT